MKSHLALSLVGAALVVALSACTFGNIASPPFSPSAETTAAASDVVYTLSETSKLPDHVVKEDLLTVAVQITAHMHEKGEAPSAEEGIEEIVKSAEGIHPETQFIYKQSPEGIWRVSAWNPTDKYFDHPNLSLTYDPTRGLPA